MPIDTVLEATARGEFGKNEARRLRSRGQIPAVLYGPPARGGAPSATPLAVDPKVLFRILHSESGVNTLIALQVPGAEETRVLVKEYQVDPVTHRLLHVDFYRVAMDRALVVTVPITLEGEARGVKQQGGLLDFVHREVQIECLPGEIPESIEVDVSELLIGQGIRLRDVVGDVRWKPKSDPDTLLVHVIAPKLEEPEPTAPEAAAPAAPSEPELIKKGKADKAEEE